MGRDSTTAFRRSGEELEDLRERRLRYTVKYAYENSPYYRELMEENDVSPEDIRDVSSLRDLPVTYGDDVRNNQPPVTDSFRLRNTDIDGFRSVAQTSGSTGMPKTRFYSHDEWRMMMEAGAEILSLQGIEPGTSAVNYLPYVGLNLSGRCHEGMLSEHRCPAVPLANTSIAADKELKYLRQFDPEVLIGTPSQMDAKLRKFLDAGKDPADIGVSQLYVVSEPITDQRKRRLERYFDAAVNDALGMTETGMVATERPSTDYMHVIDHTFLYEVIDEETGEPVEPGEQGLVVVTFLLETGAEAAMPLIRYAPGDYATRVDGDGPYSAVRDVHRTDDEFILGGVNMDIMYVEEQLMSVVGDDWTGEYQVVLEYDGDAGKDVMAVRIEPANKDIDGRTRQRIKEALLDNHFYLDKIVRDEDWADITVRTETISFGAGKPDRIVDEREE